jgi:AP-3 complex subunit beta
MASKYFSAGASRDDDIKAQLASPNNKEVMDGMKRLIANISKGRDVSEYFPDVVKLVISDSLDVKKLVYTFLLHYAEQKQDEALLSINSFQKDLSNRNQYIRAMALRVMSSIRVPVIAQILTLGIKKCATDVSPYVRKTAATAISKVYHLDQNERDALTEIIGNLLGDPSPVVLGSAMFAFAEVCPDNWQMLHKQYRRICRMLVDVDEWGQVVIINTLLRYARSQFLSPFKGDKAFKNIQASFYSSDSDTDVFHGKKDSKDANKEKMYDRDLDDDHRLLLRSAQPLLQSRNSAVVMAVASLFFHIAPPLELSKIPKPLVRLMRGNQAVAYVILKNIHTIASERPTLFLPFLKDFYVLASDSPAVASYKVDILTVLADTSNVMTILKEFQQYVKSATETNRVFLRKVIQAIGKIAHKVTDVAETCLSGLVGLLHHKITYISAEAVIVIRNLLNILQKSEYKKIVVKLAKVYPTIKETEARASIVWTIGEYTDRIPHISREFLRRLVVAFCDESVEIKKQTLYLAMKINDTKMLTYVCDLAKVDEDVDVRDLSRMIRLMDDATRKQLLKQKSSSKDKKKGEGESDDTEESVTSRFAIGSLSSLLERAVSGYVRLPDFPESQPDKTVRDVVEHVSKVDVKESKKKAKKSKNLDNVDEFYASTSEDEEDEDESEEEEEGDVDIFYGKRSKRRAASSDEDEDSEEEEDDDEDEDDDESEEDSEEEETEEDSEEEDSEEESSEDETPKKKQPAAKNTKTPSAQLDDLLGFGNASPSSLKMDALTLATSPSSQSFALPAYKPVRHQLLKASAGGGLVASYAILRELSTYGAQYSLIKLFLQNDSEDDLQNIRVSKGKSAQAAQIEVFNEVAELEEGDSASALMSIDFQGKTSAVRFALASNKGEFPVTISPSLGDLTKPMPMTVKAFDDAAAKLQGMSEKKIAIEWEDDAHNSLLALLSAAMWITPVAKEVKADETIYKMATKVYAQGGKEIAVYMTIRFQNGKARIAVQCEDMVILEEVISEIKEAIEEEESEEESEDDDE